MAEDMKTLANVSGAEQLKFGHMWTLERSFIHPQAVHRCVTHHVNPAFEQMAGGGAEHGSSYGI